MGVFHRAKQVEVGADFGLIAGLHVDFEHLELELQRGSQWAHQS